MAIVDDIRKDKRTKLVLAQTNTKTVSVPPASTGLTGDQSPAEVFSVDDFDIVKNQVHLEEKNFQLLEALNTMGQITNMQSQSGPIPGTQKIVAATVTGSGLKSTLFRPDTKGEVWQLVDASFDLQGSSGSVNLRLYLTDGSNSVISEHESASADGEYTITNASPIFLTYDVYLQAWSQGTFDDVVWTAVVCRVR